MECLSPFLTFLLSANPNPSDHALSSQYDPVGSRNIYFSIAGGEVISIKLGVQGILPAENDFAIVSTPGFVIEPSPSNSKQPMLKWRFKIRSKVSSNIMKVTIDEVAPSKKGTNYIKDGSPDPTQSTFLLCTKEVPVSKTNTPWLYSSDKTNFVFKFTFAIQGQEPSVLYQACWYSRALKSLYLNKAKVIRSSK